MTDKWKSNPMHWCDLCRCWMNDSKQSILNHERGTKHQESLARKLRDMAKKADAEKVAERQLTEAMGSIEKSAAAAYARDVEAAKEAEHRALLAAADAAGGWEWDAAAAYYYNEKHRWYYDPKTKWYYGGEPVAWAQDPPVASLPPAARFGRAPHLGGPEPPFDPKKARAAAAAAAGGGGGGGGGGAAGVVRGGGGGVAYETVKKVVALPQHPQALIGGHQLHHVQGKIGGAKGVGSSDGDDGKRKRDDAAAAKGGKGGGKPADPAEAAALARREAARQRVNQRTQQSFGLS
ncbi:MAG: hypothetical protein J3K34DRAFT_480668 [Monoraphidium minutum]|nr:MAG: hypothetical protein J3K34DRAFT_480668 [Monoraphidium minutum]